MAKVQPAIVKCKFCGEPFDRNKCKFCKPASNRYAHPECALKETEAKGLPSMEVFDPVITTVCPYCRKLVDKKEGVQIRDEVWAHVPCKQYEDTREKTDADLLNDYLLDLFGGTFVSPHLQRQVDQFIEEGYTHSGILKTLKYFYEVKNGDINKANGLISIVKFVYPQAKRYYYDIWLAEQANKKVEVKPVESITVNIRPPKRETKKNNKFNFLDEDGE